MLDDIARDLFSQASHSLPLLFSLLFGWMSSSHHHHHHHDKQTNKGGFLAKETLSGVDTDESFSACCGSGIWYFGYGAMVNPIARARRGVETLHERAAMLHDFRLTFGDGGAGNIVRQRGWTVHGVVMECKAEKDWELLQAFEAGYDCVQLDVLPYDTDKEETICAHVFVMERDPAANAKLPMEKLPQERFIRVMATGMQHHGIDADYIESSVMNVPYLPSRRPDEYLTFPNQQEQRKSISCREYVHKANKKKKVWFLIGTRIIQLDDNHDPQSAFCKFITRRLVGQVDCTWLMIQTFWDPDLPTCASPTDIQPLHTAWTENQLMEMFQQANLTGTCVGIVKGSGRVSTRSSCTNINEQPLSDQTAMHWTPKSFSSSASLRRVSHCVKKRLSLVKKGRSATTG